MMNHRPIRSLKTSLGLAAVTLAMSLTAAADDQDSVDYRQHIMKTMDEQVAALKMITQKRAPAENFAAHAKLLAESAATAKKSFEPKAPGGNAKPDVWSNWADFSKRMDALTAAADELAKASATGGVAAATPKIAAALACKGCHDQYMTPRK